MTASGSGIRTAFWVAILFDKKEYGIMPDFPFEVPTFANGEVLEAQTANDILLAIKNGWHGWRWRPVGAFHAALSTEGAPTQFVPTASGNALFGATYWNLASGDGVTWKLPVTTGEYVRALRFRIKNMGGPALARAEMYPLLEDALQAALSSNDSSPTPGAQTLFVTLTSPVQIADGGGMLGHIFHNGAGSSIRVIGLDVEVGRAL